MDKEVNNLENDETFELKDLAITLPTLVYDDFNSDIPAISISPRDKLSFIDDKKEYKKHHKYLDSNKDLYRFSRIIQTEIIKNKPQNILDFINDEFFSLENQQKLRLLFKT